MKKAVLILGLLMAQMAFAAELSTIEKVHILDRLFSSSLTTPSAKSILTSIAGSGPNGPCTANFCAYTIINCEKGANGNQYCKFEAIQEIRERGLTEHQEVQAILDAESRVLEVKDRSYQD